MSRSITVLAWILATLISVGVSTAAVGEVRDQVSQRPALVSLATLRQATTSTTIAGELSPVAFPSAEPVPSPETTTTTVAETTTTTAPPPTATTRAPTTTAATIAPTSASHSAAPGSVVVDWTGERLKLRDVDPASGYEWEPWGRSDTELIVGFVASDRMWAIIAQLVDGRIAFSEWGPRALDGSPYEEPPEDDGGDGDRKRPPRGSETTTTTVAETTTTSTAPETTTTTVPQETTTTVG